METNNLNSMTTEEQKAVEEAANKHELFSSIRGDKYSFVKGAEFLSNLRKPSEPKIKVGEPSEELVEKIHETLDECVGEMGFYKISKRIAKLMQPDVNAELLSALDKISNAPLPFNEYEKDVFIHEAIHIASEAISNYEKQQ